MSDYENGLRKGIEIGIAATKDAYVICFIIFAIIGFIIYEFKDMLVGHTLIVGLILAALGWALLIIPGTLIDYFIDKRR